MAKFKGIIENLIDYGQIHFEIEAETQAEAEVNAVAKESYESGFPVDKLEILVCVEMLTQEQADAFEKEQPNESPGV